MTGQFGMEQVVSLHRNRWSGWTGIRTEQVKRVEGCSHFPSVVAFGFAVTGRRGKLHPALQWDIR